MLRYGTLRIETYGSTLRYGFLRYVTLREGGKHALVVNFFALWSTTSYNLSLVNKDVGGCCEVDQLRAIETAWN